jgi:hypothetical protein
MSHEFTKLSEVELLNEVPEGATAIAEVNGEIKRVPSTGLGGGGVKTAVIKSDDYDNAISGLSTAIAGGPALSTNCSCINMTFDEAYQTLLNGEPLAVFYMGVMNGSSPINCYGMVSFAGTAINGIPCIVLAIPMSGSTNTVTLYWRADGISEISGME